jgi:hypothetical protein
MITMTKAKILRYTHTTFKVMAMTNGCQFLIQVTKKELREAFRKCKRFAYTCDVSDYENGKYHYHTIVILL